MLVKNIVPIHSPEFVGLSTLFHNLERPYKLGDILKFNRTYQPIYGLLGKEEKRRAEEFVDNLVAGVESRDLVSKIFGVV